jgi:hypothetical protein
MGVRAANQREAKMLTQEKENISATVTIRVAERRSAGENGILPSQVQAVVDSSADPRAGLFEFAGNAPVTFAERYPRLMVGAVSVAVVVTAITAEIECLRAAGYYWP